MTKISALSVLVCTAIAASSCATLFQGTNEEIMVASDPAGAQVSVNDGRSGVTPYSMRVNRDEDLQIHVAKAGYASYDEADTSHIEWGYLVSDIFFTGLIGLAVDGIDGAMFYHNHSMVTAHLDPAPGSPAIGGVQPPATPAAVVASAAVAASVAAAPAPSAIASDQKPASP